MFNQIKYIYSGKKYLFLFIYYNIIYLSLLEGSKYRFYISFLNLLISKQETNIEFIDQYFFFPSGYKDTNSLIFFCIGDTH